MKAFQYRPFKKYLILFIPGIISLPLVTYVVFYSFILPNWEQSNPEEHFYNIKQILVKYGKISQMESENFTYNDIKSNTSYSREAVRLVHLDLGFQHIIIKLVAPLLVVIIIFILFTFNYWVPGITKNINPMIQKGYEKNLDYLPEKTLNFLNDFNKVTITVDGFIISILGGFLISSGLNNFYFFLGFETIVFSLISNLLAYPSLISSVKLEQSDNRLDKMIAMEKTRLVGYFKVSCFSSWLLILGLILLAASFS